MAFVLGCITRAVGRKIRKADVNRCQISFKAAVLNEYMHPLNAARIPRPSGLKDNQIRIKVQYCSVNPSDVEIVKGQHEYKPQLPFVPGYEMAGEVVDSGPIAREKGFLHGSKVIALNKESCGGFAEECIVSEEDCYHIPHGVSIKNSSALLDGYITALLGLVRRGNLQEAETVLVTAAGGGVGLAAVDLAANVYKAKVIAACSTENKAALVREKGAFTALKYSDNLAEKVMKLTKGKGVSLVFDATGGEVFKKALKCISNEGRMVLASNAARSIKTFSLSSLLPSAVSVTAVSPWHYRKKDFDTYARCIQDIIDMAEQELITPHISQEFELDEINSAFDYLLDPKCTGKVVVRIN